MGGSSSNSPGNVNKNQLEKILSNINIPELVVWFAIVLSIILVITLIVLLKKHKNNTKKIDINQNIEKCEYCKSSNFLKQNNKLVCKNCTAEYLIKTETHDSALIKENSNIELKISLLLITLLIVIIGSLYTWFNYGAISTITINGLTFEKENNSYTLTSCESTLSEINIPDKVRGLYVEEIGKNAFIYNKYIKKIVIPSNVKTIGNKAFAGCTNLEDIYIPESIKYIDDQAFYNCTSLKKIELNVWYCEIGESAFEGCERLEKATIDGVSKMKTHVFKDCKSLKSIKIPHQMKFIPSEAFSGCESLKAIYIPCTIEKIYVKDPFFANVQPYNLLFYNCNDELKIFYQKETIPEGFEEYWNFNYRKQCYFEIITNTTVEEYQNYVNQNIETN